MTLVESEEETTWGIAFKVHASQACSTIAYLNHREQGYSTRELTFYPSEGADHTEPMTVLAYIGTEASSHYLGQASEDSIARQVVSTEGCSGSNTEYVLNLASSMREIAPEVHDEHLFTLETKIKELLAVLSVCQEVARHSVVSVVASSELKKPQPVSVM